MVKTHKNNIFNVLKPKSKKLIIDDLKKISEERLESLLFSDAVKGFDDYIEFYIKAGVNINCISSTGRTALIYAAKWNNIKTCKLLLKNGANVHIIDKTNHNALWYAKLNKNMDLLTLINNHKLNKDI